MLNRCCFWPVWPHTKARWNRQLLYIAYSTSNLLMKIVSHQLFIGRQQWPCCIKFKFVTDNVAHIDERNILASLRQLRHLYFTTNVHRRIVGWEPREGILLPIWSAVFSYICCHQSVGACRLLSVGSLSIVSVSGQFLLSVAGYCLLIADTGLSGAAVCSCFWFLLVSCQLLHIDCIY